MYGQWSQSSWLSPHRCPLPPERQTTTSVDPAVEIPSGVRQLGGLQTFYAGSDLSQCQIVLVCDVHGYEDPNLRKLACEIARSGFYVVVPDILRGDPYVPGNPDRPISEWMQKHETDVACEDLKVVCISLGYCESWIHPMVGLAGFGWGAKVVVELLQPQPIPDLFMRVGGVVLFDPLLVTPQDMQGVCKHVLVLGAEICSGDADTSLAPLELLKQFKDIFDTKEKVKSRVEIFHNVTSGWVLRDNKEDEETVKSADNAVKIMLDWFRPGGVAMSMFLGLR